MRALLEKEKNTTDISEVNNATLELKLAGQMAGMKDPGFSLGGDSSTPSGTR